MKQLTSTYKFKDYTWSDGTKGSVEDFKLAYKIDCDKESGATTFETCDQIQKVDFGTGLEYTVTWLPGSQYSLYFLAPIGTINGASYPATRFWPMAASWPTSRRRNGRPCPRSPRSR